MELPRKKRRNSSKQFCPHCEKKVSTSTWYRHYSQFYDPSTSEYFLACLASSVQSYAMGLLFKFVGMLLKKLVQLTGCQRLHPLYELFPDTLEKAHTMQSIKRNNFQKLIVCPKCHSTHDFIGEREIPRCSYVRFPRALSPCNQTLITSLHYSLHHRNTMHW
jgi:uncharacterized CHY-type Zn-finger protein